MHFFMIYHYALCLTDVRSESILRLSICWVFEFDRDKIIVSHDQDKGGQRQESCSGQATTNNHFLHNISNTSE